MKRMNMIFIFIILLILNACGGSGTKESKLYFDYQKIKPVCSTEGKKRFVYELFNDAYYWADSVPDINLSSYETIYQLLDVLKKKPEDRFSFVIPQSYYGDIFVDGEITGYGIKKSNSLDNGTMMIYAIYKDSPLYYAGVRRGDVILNPTNMEGNFRVLKRGTQDVVDIHVTPQKFKIKNVINHHIFTNQNGKKVGYFTLYSFVGPNLKEEIDSEFAKLKRADVDELIVDLRYNPGGLLKIASYLGSLIGGDRVGGKVFIQQKYNRKYSKYNESFYFPKNLKNALNLDRVFFIITEDSASASEALIDGLKPFIDVITVGSKSYGKQFGMHLVQYCDIVVAAIDTKNFNANGDSNYTNGITPTCKASDDLAHLLGDKDEGLIKEALYYITFDKCSDQ